MSSVEKEGENGNGRRTQKKKRGREKMNILKRKMREKKGTGGTIPAEEDGDEVGIRNTTLVPARVRGKKTLTTCIQRIPYRRG